jgi:ribose 5-phosphate isomerase B
MADSGGSGNAAGPSSKLRVTIGSDHAGFPLKVLLVDALRARGIGVVDCGTASEAQIDYPPFCFAVAESVGRGDSDWGIVLGGSGQGEQMAANKIVGSAVGVRAALCNSPYYATLARRDNDANVLAIGARVVSPHFAIEILDAWLKTTFLGGRHKRRIDLIRLQELSQKG